MCARFCTEHPPRGSSGLSPFQGDICPVLIKVLCSSYSLCHSRWHLQWASGYVFRFCVFRVVLHFKKIPCQLTICIRTLHCGGFLLTKYTDCKRFALIRYILLLILCYPLLFWISRLILLLIKKNIQIYTLQTSTVVS